MKEYPFRILIESGVLRPSRDMITHAQTQAEVLKEKPS
jgi:hypothetical protein